MEYLTILFLVILLFYLLKYKSKKNVKKIIKRFEEHEAFEEDSAISKQKLGIENEFHKEFSLKFFRRHGKDTLQVLLQKGVVKKTEDGRYYLTKKLDLVDDN